VIKEELLILCGVLGFCYTARSYYEQKAAIRQPFVTASFDAESADALSVGVDAISEARILSNPSDCKAPPTRKRA
jgi:hypothetical protein